MKRMVSRVLAAALTVSLTLPAAAAGAEATQDARLAQVTQAVKDTLELNTEAYDSFYGECYDQELVSQWSLHWDGPEGSLAIDALEDGTVIWYSLSLREEGTQPGLPSYPGGDSVQAQQAAQNFADKLLDPELESVSLEKSSDSDRLGQDTYRFEGTILYYGLPSPLNCTVEVDGTSGQVTYFYRDIPYGSYFGSVPNSTPAIHPTAAAQALKSSLSLKLEYVLPENEISMAVLRYVPDSRDEYYVDAQSGALVNLSELERKMADQAAAGSSADTGASPEASNSSASDSALSQAEQEGIQKLEGVLSRDTLDQALRTAELYGLEDYTLSSASYRLVEANENQEEQVLCTLRYLLPSESSRASRTFTVDARTGQVEDLWSYLPWEEDQQPSLTLAQAQTQAETFLNRFCPDRAETLALYRSPTPEDPIGAQYHFTFARQVNGYFFPEHSYAVSVSSQDGSICGLSYVYDEATAFDRPEGICTEQEALDAWMNTYTVTLGYLLVPEALHASDPAAVPYLQMGLNYFYGLTLGYALERENSFLGIDAKTGTPVQRETADSGGLTYTDLSGHWAQSTIETLAQYRIGYDGGTFAPNQAMTQWDLVALLFSLENYPLDPSAATQEERDFAYAAAYRMGALLSAERRDDAVLTRSEAVKLLLHAEGLRHTAQLTGIFTCTYRDRDSIPSEDLGYAALAQGIGLVGDTWAGSRTATRAEGAIMLHKLLDW